MNYDLKDDMLECFCGNSKYKHYYYPKEKKIIYYPLHNTVTTQNKRCKFFHNNSNNSNNCNNKNCNFQHIKEEELPVYCDSVGKYILNDYAYNIHTTDDKTLGWYSQRSYDERDDRLTI